MLSLSTLIPPGARVLFVASAGGHFSQLARIAAASPAHPESEWVTFDTPQTRGTHVDGVLNTVPYISPRDWRGVARAAAWTTSYLRERQFDLCISTGAALALGVLPVAAGRGIDTVYLESISRVHGPSLTGKVLSRVPRVRTFTQHRAWSSAQWPWAGSVLDTWSPHPDDARTSPRRFFVTLGTIRPYRFDRAVDAVLNVTTPQDHITWQLGCTTRNGLRGDVLHEVTPDTIERLALESDVTITHAGVGSLMQLMDLGISPTMVVREARSAEHVDDHQRQIADELLGRGLATELVLDAPDRTALDRSARVTVRGAA